MRLCVVFIYQVKMYRRLDLLTRLAPSTHKYNSFINSVVYNQSLSLPALFTITEMSLQVL